MKKEYRPDEYNNWLKTLKDSKTQQPKDFGLHYFFGEGCKISDTDDTNRTITVTMSDETLDRSDEIMIARGVQLENFEKNKVHLWCHNIEHILPPIGRYEWAKVIQKEIRGKIEFYPNDFSMGIYRMHRDHFLNGISVGYRTLKDEWPTDYHGAPNGGKGKVRRIIHEWELIEGSSVPIPMNPNALQKAIDEGSLKIPDALYKAFDLRNAEEREWNPAIQYKSYFILSDIQPIGMAQSPKANEIKEDETEDEDKIKDKDLLDALADMTALAELMEKTVADEGKPFPNEHSCRLKDPKKYPKFRRAKCEEKHDGKCIDVIYGILGPKKSDIQALRYAKDIWTAGDAKKHCDSRDGIEFAPASEEESWKERNLRIMKNAIESETVEEEEKEEIRELILAIEKMPNESEKDYIELEDTKQDSLIEISQSPGESAGIVIDIPDELVEQVSEGISKELLGALKYRMGIVDLERKEAEKK